MSTTRLSHVLSLLGSKLRRAGAWRRNEDGTAAIEFGMIVVPFVSMLVCIMGSGMQFFSQNALENGVETASRAVMTGQAQTGDPNANPPVPPTTIDQFRKKICSTAGSFVKCDNAHLRLLVNSWPDWASVAPPSCGSGGSLPSSTGSGTDLVSKYSGAPGDIVLITVCYKYDLAKGLPTYAPQKLSDGSVLMQAATAFRTEPYQ